MADLFKTLPIAGLDYREDFISESEHADLGTARLQAEPTRPKADRACAKL